MAFNEKMCQIKAFDALMSFNPDFKKWLFLKNLIIFPPSRLPIKIYFNNVLGFCASWQKGLEMFLDESLNFSY